MLYIQEKAVKLGNIYLEGQVTSVEVQAAASIYVAQDEKGRYKKSQPVGYENSKVIIDILLEDTKEATTLEQLTSMQQLFKTHGQDKPQLLPIVNEDCAARGITSVYFKSLTSKKVISESKRIASLELWAPNVAEIKVKKSSAQTATQSKKARTAASYFKSIKVREITYIADGGKKKVTNDSASNATAKRIKSAASKSPAKDNEDTTAAKKAARSIVAPANRG